MFTRSLAMPRMAALAVHLLAGRPAPKAKANPAAPHKLKNGNLRIPVMPLFSKYNPHQGAGEIARRKRQIERGILRTNPEVFRAE